MTKQEESEHQPVLSAISCFTLNENTTGVLSIGIRSNVFSDTQFDVSDTSPYFTESVYCQNEERKVTRNVHIRVTLV